MTRRLAGLALLPVSAVAAGTAAHAFPFAAVLLLGVFGLLIVLPFIPGLVEIWRPRDRYPLPVDMNYVKDPRYLGRSARALLSAALRGDDGPPGRRTVNFSKVEAVEVHDRLDVSAGALLTAIQLARGPMSVGDRAVCERDIYARAGARIGEGAVLRSLACDGRAALGRGVRITRWFDVEGDAYVGPQTALGASSAASGFLELADGVTFERLWGAPVRTTGYLGPRDLPGAPAPFALPDVQEIRVVEDLASLHRGDLTVGPGETFDRPLVVKGDLRIRTGAIVDRTVKVYGDLTLEPGALLLGDAFVEGAVIVGEGAAVRGCVFSQDSVELGRGARVGAPGLVKTVVGKRRVTLACDVAIHGYVLTDGLGSVQCRDSD
jgi:predicted acyltransferase (DUF342 family)